MKLVIQRCTSAQVLVDNSIVGQICHGLVVFTGYTQGDNHLKNKHAVNKLLNLRIFSSSSKDDSQLSIRDIGDKAGLLIISQFTLYGCIKKGTRPSFSIAADYNTAHLLYHDFIQQLKDTFSLVQTGIFGAMMEVRVNNDGPYTLIWEV